MAQTNQTELKQFEELNDYSTQKKLKQVSNYDGYVVLLDPFTSTDSYNYMDAFFLGLKLSDWYDYSDQCVNDVAFMLDDINYF